MVTSSRAKGKTKMPVTTISLGLLFRNNNNKKKRQPKKKIW